MKKIKNYLLIMLLVLIGTVSLYGCSKIDTESVLGYRVNINNNDISIGFIIGVDDFRNSDYGINVENSQMPYKIYWHEANEPENIHYINKGRYNALYSKFLFDINVSYEYLNKDIVVVITSQDESLSLMRTIRIK